MRITNNTPIRPTTRPRAADKAGGAGGSFQLQQAPATSTPQPMGSLEAPQSLGALLSLQAINDPTQERRQALSQGHSILDELEDLKIELLSGRIPEEMLQSISSRLSERHRTGEQELDELLDEIEVRARVELAKLGRFD